MVKSFGFALLFICVLFASQALSETPNVISEPKPENKPENKIDLKLNEIKTAGTSALKAQEYFNAGKYPESIAACDVVLKINPGDQKINELKQSALKMGQWHKQAEEFFTKGEYAKALELREQLTVLNPKDAIQNNLLQKTTDMLKGVKQAQTYFEQAQYQLAILEYEKIIKKNPSDQIHPVKITLCQSLSAKRANAFQYYERGRYAEAQLLFEELFAQNPTQLEYQRQARSSAQAQEALTAGDELLAKGQIEDAKNFFVKAKDLNGKDENLINKILLCDKLTWYIDQSRVLQQGGYFEEALQNWKKIVSLAPAAYYQKQMQEVKRLADIHKQFGEYQKNQNFKAMVQGMETFKEFYFYKKQLNRFEEWAALHQKGEAAFAAGDYVQAEKYFSELKKKILVPEKVTLNFSGALKPGKTVTAQWLAPSLSQIKSAWLMVPGLPKQYFDPDRTVSLDLPHALLPGFYLIKVYLQNEMGITTEEFKVIEILE